jgi:hypothetical protein
MRFNAPDSLSPFHAGGLNPYGYCKCDPINGTDPTGHVTVPIEALEGIGRDDAIAVTRAATSADSGAPHPALKVSEPALGEPLSRPATDGHAAAASGPAHSSIARLSALERVPVEAMSNIVSHLSGNDIESLSQSSYTMRNLVDLSMPSAEDAYRLLEGTGASNLHVARDTLAKSFYAIRGELNGITRRLLYKYQFDPKELYDLLDYLNPTERGNYQFSIMDHQDRFIGGVREDAPYFPFYQHDVWLRQWADYS